MRQTEYPIKRNNEHQIGRDARAILLVGAIVVLAIVLVAVYNGTNVIQEWNNFYALLRSNREDLALWQILITIAVALGTVLGRWIGHKRHESRDDRKDAEIAHYKREAEIANDRLDDKERIIEMFEERFHIKRPTSHEIEVHEASKL